MLCAKGLSDVMHQEMLIFPEVMLHIPQFLFYALGFQKLLQRGVLLVLCNFTVIHIILLIDHLIEISQVEYLVVR